MRINALASVLVACGLTLTLAGCGEKSEPAQPAAAGKDASVTITVGASPVPHADILKFITPQLAKEGVTLKVMEFTDYIKPNLSLADKEIDANFFQHITYMENFNAERGTHLVNAGAIHYEPMGIYAGQSDSLENIPDGAVIAVPNDATNEGRALLLLQDLGIITLSEDAGLEATKNDIVDNPHNIDLQEMEAAMLPQTIDEVDFSIINSNYALDAGLNPTTDALATEDAQSDAAQAYANIIAVKEGNENNEAIKALVAALQSDEIREFIETTYNGSVVPMF